MESIYDDILTVIASNGKKTYGLCLTCKKFYGHREIFLAQFRIECIPSNEYKHPGTNVVFSLHGKNIPKSIFIDIDISKLNLHSFSKRQYSFSGKIVNYIYKQQLYIYVFRPSDIKLIKDDRHVTLIYTRDSVDENLLKNFSKKIIGRHIYYTGKNYTIICLKKSHAI